MSTLQHCSNSSLEDLCNEIMSLAHEIKTETNLNQSKIYKYYHKVQNFLSKHDFNEIHRKIILETLNPIKIYLEHSVK